MSGIKESAFNISAVHVDVDHSVWVVCGDESLWLSAGSESQTTGHALANHSLNHASRRPSLSPLYDITSPCSLVSSRRSSGLLTPWTRTRHAHDWLNPRPDPGDRYPYWERCIPPPRLSWIASAYALWKGRASDSTLPLGMRMVMLYRVLIAYVRSRYRRSHHLRAFPPTPPQYLVGRVYIRILILLRLRLDQIQ